MCLETTICQVLLLLLLLLTICCSGEYRALYLLIELGPFFFSLSLTNSLELCIERLFRHFHVLLFIFKALTFIVPLSRQHSSMILFLPSFLFSPLPLLNNFKLRAIINSALSYRMEEHVLMLQTLPKFCLYKIWLDSFLPKVNVSK